MTSSNYDTMIQTGNPNEYPEYTGKLFSELSVSSQEEYAFYSDLTLVEAQKDYDSFHFHNKLYSENQAWNKFCDYNFIQKIGKPWYFIDGKLVQKDE
jgi:hypothetical protein